MKLKKFTKEYFFNGKWKCSACGREIFDGGYFCSDCEKIVPYNDKEICSHCGRKLLQSQEYCSTCKDKILTVDKCRSAFNYERPISQMIKRLKYFNRRYFADVFSTYLVREYNKGEITADAVVYVPMTEKALKKRRFNQSELIANNFCERTGLTLLHAVEKVNETRRQAKLDRKERLQNLTDAFRVKDKKSVNGKRIIIIDDVTTTGSTAEAMASKLKRAGAKAVYLLTVASVPPKDGY